MFSLFHSHFLIDIPLFMSLLYHFLLHLGISRMWLGMNRHDRVHPSEELQKNPWMKVLYRSASGNRRLERI